MKMIYENVRFEKQMAPGAEYFTVYLKDIDRTWVGRIMVRKATFEPSGHSIPQRALRDILAFMEQLNSKGTEG